MPKYSVIIPVYNGEETLLHSIESIRIQANPDIEILVVDNGSTDNTHQIISDISKKDARIRPLFCEKRGPSCARNFALDRASGDYILFLDADDMLHPHTLEVCDKYMDDGLDLIVFAIVRKEVAIHKTFGLADKAYSSCSEFADDYIHKRSLLLYSNGNKVYRRSIIERHSIRFMEDLNLGEDRLFNFAYLQHCGKIRTLSDQLYEYRAMNPNSLSTRFIPNFFACLSRSTGQKSTPSVEFPKEQHRQKRCPLPSTTCSLNWRML